jgi:nucleotide-binding universal stress UspA family protein
VLDAGAAGALMMRSAAATGVGSILLHVDASAASAVRLGIARALAARHGGSITALFGAVADDDRGYAYSAGAALDADSARAWREAVVGNLQQGATHPAQAAERWFRVAGDSVAHGFIAEAPYADLLVLGQQVPGERAPGGAPAGFVETVILESGRPVLVVPVHAPVEAIGRRVLVAWNGSVSAARALAGALVLLREAESVHVATWSRHPAAAPFSGVGIVEHLRRHGIEATPHHRGATPHVGEELAVLARSLVCDLVVMGGYGRSRASERLLGGTTRSWLQRLPVPALMAH